MIGIPCSALHTPSVRRSSRKKLRIFILLWKNLFFGGKKFFFVSKNRRQSKTSGSIFFQSWSILKGQNLFFEPSVEKKPWLARAWIRTRNLSILIQQHMPEGFEWFGRILLGLVKRAPCLQALLGHELVGWELVDHGLEGRKLVGHEKSSKRIRASLLLHNYQLL